jgi:hypothetical protein
MGRTKPKQTSKSPNKRIKEDDEQDLSISVTPKPATSRKETTETKQSNTPETKSYRTNTQIKDIYKANASMLKHMDKLDRARKHKGLQALYRDEYLLSTMDTSEHVTQGHKAPTPAIGQESSPTQEDQKNGSTRLRRKLSAFNESNRKRTPNTEHETTQRWRECSHNYLRILRFK